MIEAVFVNAKMYTMTGTFEEAISFLQGYVSGIAKGNSSAPLVIEWAEFQTWLRRKIGCPDSLYVFDCFRTSGGDNKALLQRKRNYVMEFYREYHSDENRDVTSS